MRRIIAAGFLFLLVSVAAWASLEEADITDKTDDGSILITDDGVTWKVDNADAVTTALWTVGDTLIEDDDSKGCANYRLINKDESSETACAKKVK